MASCMESSSLTVMTFLLIQFMTSILAPPFRG
jgi:hypothetical protein